MSFSPLVPKELIYSSNKILFVTHLAIGDFTYMQTFFTAFKKTYPHIQIDLWIDEVRRTRCFWQWKNLKQYALYDWVNNTGLFGTVYSQTYSWSKFKKSLTQAQREKYPIIVSLCTLRQERYAYYAHMMSKEAFVAGIVDAKKQDARWTKKLSACVQREMPEKQVMTHVTDQYAWWFEQLFGMQVANRRPFVIIPKRWTLYAKFKFIKWGIDVHKKMYTRAVFINSFAKDVRRCWSIDQIVHLVHQMQEDDRFADAHFIINVVPQYYDEVRTFLSNFHLHNVHLFSARESFFQLPAILSLCDLVISVETSVMHLASALDIPVVALMRAKNPEWAPYDGDKSTVLFAAKRTEWVEDIHVERVVESLKTFQ